MCLYQSPSPHAQTKICSPASVQSEGITVGMHHKKLALFRSEILLEYLTGCTQLTAHSSWGLQCHHHHSFYEPYGKMITLLSKHPLFHPADCLHTCSLIATAWRRTIFHAGSGDPKDSRWELHCGAAAVSVLRRCQRPSCCLLLSLRRGFGTLSSEVWALGTTRTPAPSSQNPGGSSLSAGFSELLWIHSTSTGPDLCLQVQWLCLCCVIKQNRALLCPQHIIQVHILTFPPVLLSLKTKWSCP